VAVARRGAFIYVLTARHVIAGARELRIVLAADGESATFDAELLATWPEQDLALLRIAADPKRLPVLRLAGANGKPATTGDTVLSVGFGDGKTPTGDMDRLVGKRLLRRPDGRAAFVWEVEKASIAGRSGGPLVDSAGKVIGVCLGTQDGKGYYCHLDEILAALKGRGYAWAWQESEAK